MLDDRGRTVSCGRGRVGLVVVVSGANMPVFPGDKYPIPPAEAAFRKQQAAKNGKRTTLKREERAKLRSPPSSDPIEKGARNARQKQDPLTTNQFLRETKGPKGPKVSDGERDRRLNERAEKIRKRNQKKSTSYVWTISGGLPTLGKRRLKCTASHSHDGKPARVSNPFHGAGARPPSYMINRTGQVPDSSLLAWLGAGGFTEGRRPYRQNADDLGRCHRARRRLA
jgi:hypothetical protein